MKYYTFKKFTKKSGHLVPISFKKDVPFTPKRIFLIYGKKNFLRGDHAHKKCSQFFIPISGKIELFFTDSNYSKKVILDSKKMNMAYIPKGFAHGFQTLKSNCQILYLHTEYRNQISEDGYHFDSPYLKIKWPLKLTEISDRDKNLKEFNRSSDKIKL